jgi:hypothetical protein
MLVTHDRHHRNADLLLQLRGRHVNPPPLGDVDHVQRDHQWPAEFDQLTDEIEIPLQVARIDDNDDEVRRRRVSPQAAQHFHRHVLIGRAANQTVCARQIDDVHPSPVIELASAGFLFNGDAGVVGDLLPQAGERVEDRRLARVRIAGKRNRQRGG